MATENTGARERAFKHWLVVGWGGVRDFQTKAEAVAFAREEARLYPGHFGKVNEVRVPVVEIKSQEWVRAHPERGRDDG